MPGVRALCVALAACGVLAASAPAKGPGHGGRPRRGGATQASTAASLTPSFSPDRLGASAGLTLSIDYASSEPHRVPEPVTHTVLHLPVGLTFNLQRVGTCSRARVNRTKCPASSLVGTGSTEAEAHLGSQTLGETATVTAYRGPNQGGHPTLLIASQGLTPLIERIVIAGVLERDRPPYGLELVLSIPPIPTLPTEPNASIVHFTLTIGAGRRGRGLVHLPASCPASGFPFGAQFTFAEGTTAETTATARCP